MYAPVCATPLSYQTTKNKRSPAFSLPITMALPQPSPRLPHLHWCGHIDLQWMRIFAPRFASLLPVGTCSLFTTDAYQPLITAAAATPWFTDFYGNSYPLPNAR